MSKDKQTVRELDCDEVMRQLFDFLDDEVDATANEEIHQHVEECRSCFSRVEFEQQLRERVQGAGKDSAPESLQKRVTNLMKDFSLGDFEKPDSDRKLGNWAGNDRRRKGE